MPNTINKVIKFIIALVVFLLILAVAFWFGHLADRNDFIREIIQKYGLIGVFFISFLSGFNLTLPVPAISFLPAFLAVGQNIWVLIFIITLGMTLGDFLGYIIGRYGREVAPALTFKTRNKLEKLQEKYYYLPLVFMFFYAGFVPAPNEIIVIPLGLMGYKTRHIMPVIFAGNIVFNISAAFGFMQVINLLSL